MSKIIQLKDKVTHEVAYPTTHVDAVYDNNGRDLPTILTDKADIDDLSNVLAEQVLENTRDGINALTREEAKKDLFIDLWNAVCSTNGRYNATTGYFELNGLTDITYSEAVKIYEYRGSWPYITIIDSPSIRTNLLYDGLAGQFDLRPNPHFLVRDSNIQVLRIALGSEDYGLKPNAVDGSRLRIIINAPLLTTILGVLDMGNLIAGQGYYPYSNVPKLLNCKIKNLGNNFLISSAPLLSLESLQYLVTNAANSTPITVTVHANVYAKLTDTSKADWYKVLTDAADKMISFADGGGDIIMERPATITFNNTPALILINTVYNSQLSETYVDDIRIISDLVPFDSTIATTYEQILNSFSYEGASIKSFNVGDLNIVFDTPNLDLTCLEVVDVHSDGWDVPISSTSDSKINTPVPCKLTGTIILN